MAEKIDEVVLKPNQVWGLLYGFHDNGYVDFLNVDCLRVAHSLGVILPAVDVTLIGGKYQLVYGRGFDDYFNYGGHSRSRLACDDSLSLQCNLFDSHRDNPVEDKVSFRRISDFCALPLAMRSHNMNARLFDNLKLLPKKVRDSFMCKHDLVLIKDKHLVTRWELDNPPAF